MERERLYHNAWGALERHAVIRPDGSAGEHLFVDLPPAVGVLAVDGRDVLLVSQPRYGIGRDVLEIVKGGRHDGESPEDAARRELREEAGLDAKRLLPLGDRLALPSITNERATLYAATGLKEIEAEPDGTEAIDVVRMPLDQALDRAFEGAIEDADTIVALARYAFAIGILRIE
ncbi:MAG TPA: NUDIX hydrolase [Candidatus Dormibacteraeota bacterium]|nr:NUDIX hydrolase [Candidatus Dormibacteraeota bacterium]